MDNNVINRMIRIAVRSFKPLRTTVHCFSNQIMETKVPIKDYTINYLKVGRGDHSVLCLPGFAGTIWTDFVSQINGINLNKYTLVVWDPPGYGNSRPPQRNFTPDFLSKDADIAAELMNKLDISKYSILGWSDGGITGLFMASRYQENVNKLVVWGANAYITEEDLAKSKLISNVSIWSSRMRDPFERIYGSELLSKMAVDWYEILTVIFNDHNGDICREEVKKIKVPTFILHGGKDPVVPYFHAEFLKNSIKNSKEYIFEDGKHNIHLRYAEKFNQLVEKFLEE